MNIKGLQKVTLLDYPGKVACTIFTYGCNFRCPFCQNSELVLSEYAGDYINEEEIFAYLKKRQGLLDGVCISGGEPTLQPDLERFITKIKGMDYRVKLDTNGYRPSVIQNLIDKSLIDYIAMDIKSSPRRYEFVCGVEGINFETINESINLIRSSGIEHEFRTTIVNELHSKEDFESIGRLLVGEKKYFLQMFTDSGEILCSGLTAPSEESMHEYLYEVRKFIPEARLRGIEE